MKHLLNVCNINGAEVEPAPIAVTKYHFKEVQNGSWRALSDIPRLS